MSSRSKQSLFPLILTVFIDLIGLGIAIPALTVVFLDPAVSILPEGTSFQMRLLLNGLMLGAYPLAQFFGAPLLGALSDHHGRKPVLIAAIVGEMIGYVLFAIGIMRGDLWLLFLSRALSGFMGGNISIAVAAVADVSDEESRPRNFGLIGMAFGLGFILGPFIGGKLSDPTLVPWFTLSTPFWFAAALTAFDIVLLWLIFRETLPTKLTTPVSLFTGFRNIRRAFALAHMRTILLVIFLLTLGFNFFAQFFQVFLIEKFRFGQGDIGEIFAFVGLCIAIVQGIIIRPVSKRFSPRQVLAVSSLGLALTLPLLLIPSTVPGLYLLLPLIALFQGLTEPNSTAIVSNMTDRESQGEIMGIKQSIQSLAMTVPPFSAGALAIASAYLAGHGEAAASALLANPALYTILSGVITLAAFALFITKFRETKAEVFHEVP